MNKLITATKIGDAKERNITAELPSKCPHCHTGYGELTVGDALKLISSPK